ncbi:phage tail tape measure protein [Paracandidimonas soli]|uniref:Lambda family phage tail tape measure protein n=2 Tax=Paracandidimonas soli TaxID=1917182 RepID=A0A4R3UN05_9BURK|nr:lambda family phage tail tape measure protein [Paracandidimonas soli]
MDIATLALAIDSRQTVSATSNLDKMTAAGEKAERQFGGVEKGAKRAASEINTVDRAALSVGKSLVGIGAAAAVAFGSSAVTRYADAWSDMQSRVGAAIKNMDAAPAMMRRIVDIANASYSPLAQTVEIYGRNVAVLRDLGRSSTEAADFTEALNHALVITATKGEQAASVQNALSKAMAVGKLSGDGLETVLANGGRVAEALAKSLGTNVNGLRGMAAQGKITADVIAKALIGSLDELRKEADEMPGTIGDAFARVQTNITEFVGRIDKASGVSSAMAKSIFSFADGIRVAGDYVIAFGQYAAPAFDLAGSAISAVGQYADIAAVALAGFYAPALIGGVALLTKSLAVGLVGAIKAVTVAMYANPVGALVAVLAGAAYAAYKFSEDFRKFVGEDPIETAKTAANYVIGSFVAAYEYIKFVWNNFGDMMGAAVIGGVNIAIRSINSMIQGALSGINSLADSLRSIGIDIGRIGESAGINEIANPYADRLAGAVEERNKAISAALAKDYIGAAFGGFSLPESAPYDGGGGGGGKPPSATGAGKSGSDYIKQILERTALLGKETEAEQLLARIRIGAISFGSKARQDEALAAAKQYDALSAQIEQEKMLKDLREQQSITQLQFMRDLESFGQGDRIRELNADLAKVEDRYRSLIEARRNSAQGLSDSELAQIRESLEKELSMVREYHDKKLLISQDWALGARDALINYADDAANVYQSMGNMVGNTIKGMEDSLTKFVRTGKLSFSDLTDSIISDMVRIAIQQSITGPLAGALFGAIGGAFSGAAAPAGVTPGVNWTFSSGGYTGDGGRFEPAGIVHRGEGVLNQDEIRSLGGESGFNALRRAIRGPGHAIGGMAGRPSLPSVAASSGQEPKVVIHIHNEGGGADTTEATPGLEAFGRMMQEIARTEYQKLQVRSQRQGGIAWQARQGAFS